MKDGNKILALVLGGVLGFGAVAAISRNFSKEKKEDELTFEQETPYEPVAFKDGWVLKTDLSTEDTVAYMMLPTTFATEIKTIYKVGVIYDEVCFKFGDVYSPMFQAQIYLQSTDQIEVENHGLLNLLIDEEGCLSTGSVEVYYVPLTQEFLTAVENYNANDMGMPLKWQEDEDGNQYCTACLDGMTFGSKSYMDGSYDIDNYIDPSGYFSGPLGTFTLYKVK